MLSVKVVVADELDVLAVTSAPMRVKNARAFGPDTCGRDVLEPSDQVGGVMEPARASSSTRYLAQASASFPA